MERLPKPPQREVVTETEWLRFKTSEIHGTGAFARSRVPRGTVVIEYVGERITKQESLRRCEANNQYIFALDDTWDLDGSAAWNAARFINHSCQPNCAAENRAGKIEIVALRDLEPGEEVTFNYGFDLQDYREHPCRCGASGCVGFIVAEELFEHVRRAHEVRSAG